MTYRTMQLDTSTWDLTLDGNGNLAIAEESYSVAQDVASACLVFSGECYYDNTLGISWKAEVLGRRPSPGFIAQKMQAEALKLPVVEDALASVFFDKNTRTTRGTIRVTDINGNIAQATL
ncbi:hypothetical protein MLP94_02170 [Escherichia coli]|uniref:hypothetical protein n=1 Tax=Escherichia coli TaxID=562 RepID=UPI001801C25E|nr:hypothetical protein [Escherichia coli]EFC2565587.1 hypothetical protein [Escherichia coli]EIG1530324.1 hypothetical protein [Escherichia coli]EIL3223775.1 hypothetical protein [Escherichia coli]EIR5313573.1 hypothetical protein [Escherichia coli]